jgi:hypothetical protein
VREIYSQVDAESGFVSVYCVEVAIVTYVSGVHASSIFRIEVNRIGQCSCTCRSFI